MYKESWQQVNKMCAEYVKQFLFSCLEQLQKSSCWLVCLLVSLSIYLLVRVCEKLTDRVSNGN